jgi:hypothetical protein
MKEGTSFPRTRESLMNTMDPRLRGVTALSGSLKNSHSGMKTNWRAWVNIGEITVVKWQGCAPHAATITSRRERSGHIL